MVCFIGEKHACKGQPYSTCYQPLLGSLPIHAEPAVTHAAHKDVYNTPFSSFSNVSSKGQDQRWEAIPSDRLPLCRQYSEGPAPSCPSHNTNTSKETKDSNR